MNKLNINWQPGWRIVQVTSPTTYLIHNQLTGCTTKANIVHLRRASVDEWVAPKTGNSEGRALKKQTTLFHLITIQIAMKVVVA